MPVVREQVAVRDGCRNQLHDLSIAIGQALIGVVFHQSARKQNSSGRTSGPTAVAVRHSGVFSRLGAAA